MSGPALSIRGLLVVRGRRDVLRLETLEVAPGETLAVLGPNGAGKSTLLLTAALLLAPTAGEVRIFGSTANEAGRVALRRRSATVFQDPSLLDMSVRQNVETALAIHGVPAAERRMQAERWLDRLGVGHLATARPHTLSGGEAQRVSLARAFAVEPQLLFLDEPFAGLDYSARAQLIGDLRTLLASEGTTVLLATHDNSEAELLADRALVLIDGIPAQIGPVEDVFAHPGSIEVARFLGFSAIPSALLRSLPGVGYRPAALALVPSGAAALASAADAGVLPGSILAVQGAVGQARLLVDVGAPLAVAAPVSDVRALGLVPGTPVYIRIDPTRIAWF